MVLLSRKVQEIKDQDSKSADLDKLRSVPAWILLGEPGAGKTTVFKEEAKACGGEYLTVAKFVSVGVKKTWENKTLFLDGLDEIRDTLEKDQFKIQENLEKLKNPFFRISCRAADWFGSSYKDTFKEVSGDTELGVYCLRPLETEDIKALLRATPNEIDVEKFMDQAKRYGINSFLTNPHTLLMLAEIWKKDEWPTTKKAIYEEACKKLIAEPSKSHRYQNRSKEKTMEPTELLEEAGRLCAVMLLSGSSGVALDPESADKNYPYSNDFGVKNTAVLNTRIFVPSESKEERVEPTHRSIAEYLAARWLGTGIDNKQLLSGRLLNLMLGRDQKPVSGLKGLYAWLAVHSMKAGKDLIQKDPLAVLLDGDVQSMSVEDKKILLKALKIETKHDVVRMWEVTRGGLSLGLYGSDLNDVFKSILSSTERGESEQAYVWLVLSGLKQSELPSDLVELMRTIAADDSRHPWIREDAIGIWLVQAQEEEALDFLDDIQSDAVKDSHDQLAGLILSKLYERGTSPLRLWKYVHPPKNPNFTGRYRHFVADILVQNLSISIDDVPALIDCLGQKIDDWLEGGGVSCLRGMVENLLKKFILEKGDLPPYDDLCRWVAMIGHSFSGDFREFFIEWLSQRPEQYKALYKKTRLEGHSNTPWALLEILDDVHPSGAWWHWFLEEMQTLQDDNLVKRYLAEAVRVLLKWGAQEGLTLEMIFEWAGRDETRQTWLKPLLVSELKPLLVSDYSILRTNEQPAKKAGRKLLLKKQKADIVSGRAPAGRMHELAEVWEGSYQDMPGDTPKERFKNYGGDVEDMYDVIEEGFKKCVQREDVPSSTEIIELQIKQKRHLLTRPCLLGMELRYKEPGLSWSGFDENILKRMIAFKLVSPTREPHPQWYLDLVEQRPLLVADVFFEYADKVLAAKKDSVLGFDELCYDDKFHNVALSVVPRLLRAFPLRARSFQRSDLTSLFIFALRHLKPEVLEEIIKEKIALKSLAVLQKVYWLTVGMLLKPDIYEKKLGSYIRQSEKRKQIVCDFFRNCKVPLEKLSAETLSWLIELLVPHSDFSRDDSGWVTVGMNQEEVFDKLMTALAEKEPEDSLEAVEQLLKSPRLSSGIRRRLEILKHELRNKVREQNFVIPTASSVLEILSNQKPQNSKDLLSLVLFHIEELAKEIRESDANLYESFWNERDSTHKSENSCRNVLLRELRQRLSPFDCELSCLPESPCVGNNRADITVSSSNREMYVPIEVKGEWHEDLWTAMNEQLDKKYTLQSKGGYGIYLVLWFGGSCQKEAKDGGKRATSAQELADRLRAMISEEKKEYIHVRVLDVSWPKK